MVSEVPPATQGVASGGIAAKASSSSAGPCTPGKYIGIARVSARRSASGQSPAAPSKPARNTGRQASAGLSSHGALGASSFFNANDVAKATHESQNAAPSAASRVPSASPSATASAVAPIHLSTRCS